MTPTWFLENALAFPMVHSVRGGDESFLEVFLRMHAELYQRNIGLLFQTQVKNLRL